MCLCWLQKNRWYAMRHEACWNKAPVNVLWVYLSEFRKHVMWLQWAWSGRILKAMFPIPQFNWAFLTQLPFILILTKTLTQLLWRITSPASLSTKAQFPVVLLCHNSKLKKPTSDVTYANVTLGNDSFHASWPILRLPHMLFDSHYNGISELMNCISPGWS